VSLSDKETKGNRRLSLLSSSSSYSSASDGSDDTDFEDDTSQVITFITLPT